MIAKLADKGMMIHLQSQKYLRPEILTSNLCIRIYMLPSICIRDKTVLVLSSLSASGVSDRV